DKKQLIPLVGTIAAGMPILAEENIEDHIDLYKFFYSDAEIFALRVKGDSMKKAGIMDGDIVVIKKQPVIENGQIGAFIINDEATVKRIFFKSDRIILKPENDEMKEIMVDPKKNNFYIAGKVIGVIRRMS
ncbi:MAG: repressor LexA, partial [Spirochaetes bacterium]|nr:repressor LexA [Spirochaetota bacterium]